MSVLLNIVQPVKLYSFLSHYNILQDVYSVNQGFVHGA